MRVFLRLPRPRGLSPRRAEPDRGSATSVLRNKSDRRHRVVHHVLVDYLERYRERVFIHDSYACRQGQGTHAAVARLQGFIRQVTANGQRPAWYLPIEKLNTQFFAKPRPRRQPACPVSSARLTSA